jgi:hypothetical protein
LEAAELSKLLRADFARLFKSKSFYIFMAVMALYSIGISLMQYKDKMDGLPAAVDTILFSPFIDLGFMVALFSSFFIGTEFSDGAFRNKLIVGHGRASMYLANFLTSSTAAVFMLIAYYVFALALGIPLLGMPLTSPQTAFGMIFAGLMATWAFAAFYTFLSMLIQSKASSAIVAIAFAAIFIFGFMYGRMQEAETVGTYALTTENDGSVATQQVEAPNPRYLKEHQRAAYQMCLDFFPSGQALQISMGESLDFRLMVLCSSFIILALNAFGIFIFQRRDLK